MLPQLKRTKGYKNDHCKLTAAVGVTGSCLGGRGSAHTIAPSKLRQVTISSSGHCLVNAFWVLKFQFTPTPLPQVCVQEDQPFQGAQEESMAGNITSIQLFN